jgi:hypothetical protein
MCAAAGLIVPVAHRLTKHLVPAPQRASHRPTPVDPLCAESRAPRALSPECERPSVGRARLLRTRCGHPAVGDARSAPGSLLCRWEKAEAESAPPLATSIAKLRRQRELADYMGYCPHRREGHMTCGTRDGRTLSRRRLDPRFLLVRSRQAAERHSNARMAARRARGARGARRRLPGWVAFYAGRSSALLLARSRYPRIAAARPASVAMRDSPEPGATGGCYRRARNEPAKKTSGSLTGGMRRLSTRPTTIQ